MAQHKLNRRRAPVADLSELIERLKKATGSDHVLDRDVWEAVTGKCTHRNTHYVELENDERELECSDCGADTYGSDKWSGLTRSVDQAGALVELALPGCGWSVDRRARGKAWAGIEQGDDYWTYAGWPSAAGAVPAIALCLALLYAISELRAEEARGLAKTEGA
jgi:hypothetical protein